MRTECAITECYHDRNRIKLLKCGDQIDQTTSKQPRHWARLCPVQSVKKLIEQKTSHLVLNKTILCLLYAYPPGERNSVLWETAVM